jgi:hypothetical protein
MRLVLCDGNRRYILLIELVVSRIYRLVRPRQELKKTDTYRLDLDTFKEQE